MIPDGLILFGQAYKIAPVRRIDQSYSGNGSPTIKLVIRKEERDKRARERLLTLVLERESQERERVNIAYL